jgi:hypothetical protein
VVPATFGSRLNDRRTGAVATLQLLRGDRLLVVPVTLQEDRKTTYKIVEDPNAPAAARALRDSWLRPGT